MQRGNLDKWININDCNNLLFFSQLVQELLFDYSIPSNRVSTLNSHFLVLDALSAINCIESSGVPEGTLKPIMEELYYEIEKDIVFKSEEPLNFFVKNQNGKVVSHIQPRELNYLELKKCATALNTIFFSNNEYYNQLKEKIIKIIEDNKIEDQQDLFKLTKSVLTELMNNGYSLKYIHHTMDRLFWNSKTNIEDNSLIETFFDSFNFIKKEYTIIFKVKWIKMQPFINHFEELELVSELPGDLISRASSTIKRLKNDEKYLVIKKKALDPFSAANSAIGLIEDNTSVYRLYNHSYRYDIHTANYIVLDQENFYKKGKRISGVQHIKIPRDSQIKESLDLAASAISGIAESGHINDFFTILSAVKYHSHSLDSRAEENQLLDFWAIFEAVLDVSNKHTSDRIQQICDYLIPILKHNYIYSLFSQLANDIKQYDRDWFNDYVNTNNEEEIVKLIAEFTLLEEKNSDRENFFQSCEGYPLLIERIQYYNKALSNTNLVHQYVEKHAKRVQWQIMRIYRNRNLIIHNAEKMPYLTLLIENLHSYVDDFLNHVIHEFSNGRDISSMCQELFVKECKWAALFGRQKEQITTNDIKEILQM